MRFLLPMTSGYAGKRKTGIHRLKNQLLRVSRRQIPVYLLTLFTSGVIHHTAAARQFADVTVETDFQITHPVQASTLGSAADHFIILAGHDDDLKQRMAIYRLDDVQGNAVSLVASIDPDSHKIAYDVARFADHEALVFIEPGRIVSYVPASDEFVEIAKVQSIYQQERSGELERINFFRDLNADELDDLVISDGAGYRVRLQRSDGSLGPESLLPKSIGMSFSDRSVRFRKRSLVSGDMNFDGRTDLAVWRGGILQVYLQSIDGRFSETVIERDTGLGVLSEMQLRMLETDRGAVNREGLVEKRIEIIQDLNGDQLPDVLTDATHNNGLFDRRSEVRLHLGRPGGEFVSFDKEEDALLDSEGLQFDPISTDIDNDGRNDLIIRTVKLSFGRLIRALLSGGVQLQLQFYRMSEDDTYPAKPNYTAKTKVRFSRSSGQVDIPTFEVADYDGDGLQDLMLQSTSEELGFYRGIASEDLFNKTPEKIKTELPRNGELVDAIDINDDGYSDLAIRYSVADSRQLAQTLRLLIHTGKQE